MNLFIIEGTDRIGKNTFIKNLCNYFDYNNVTVRHFGAPPKNLTNAKKYKYQTTAFNNELRLLQLFVHNESLNNEKYFDNTVIFNRSHIGEYVYGQLYRNVDKNTICNFIYGYDVAINYNKHIKPYVIHLTADAEFLVKKDDGLSISNELENKKKEINMFNTIINKIQYPNKITIKVNDGDNYRDHNDVWNEFLNFYKIKSNEK